MTLIIRFILLNYYFISLFQAIPVRTNSSFFIASIQLFVVVFPSQSIGFTTPS